MQRDNDTNTWKLGNPLLLVRPLENFCIAETDGCAAATGLQQPAECLSPPLFCHSLSLPVVCHVVCCAVPISSLTGLCRRLLHMCVKQRTFNGLRNHLLIKLTTKQKLFRAAQCMINRKTYCRVYFGVTEIVKKFIRDY